MLVARRWLAAHSKVAPVSGPRLADWIDSYGLADREFRIVVGAESALIDKRLEQLDLRGTAGINILGIERSTPFGRRLIQPEAETVLQADDALLLDVFGKGTDIDAFCRAHDLTRLPISGAYFTDHAQEIGMAELIVPPGSPLADKSIAGSRSGLCTGWLSSECAATIAPSATWAHRRSWTAATCCLLPARGSASGSCNVAATWLSWPCRENWTRCSRRRSAPFRPLRSLGSWWP